MADETRSDEKFTKRGLSRRTIVGATAWAVPAIAAVVASPAAAVSVLPGGPVYIPPVLTGVVGGGWSIATKFDAGKGLPSGTLRSATATATAVPITVSPAKATNVTMTISGTGFSFFRVGDNVGFSAIQSMTVTTAANGVGVVYVAIPPAGVGASSAVITAVANGSTATATLAARTGYAYTVGGRSAQGQTANGASLGSVSYPTPWALDEPLAQIGVGRSVVFGISGSGVLRGSGVNTYGEIGTGGNIASTLALQDSTKDDGSPFTDAARFVASQSGADQGLVIVQDTAGDWWATGQQVSNYLAIPGHVTTSTVIKRFTRIGGDLPGKPVWVSLNRNDAVLIWTLDDGTVWLTGDATKFAKFAKGLPVTRGEGVVQQLLFKDGSPVTGIAKAVQADDWTLMMLAHDGRVLFSGSATASYTPGGYVDDGYVHEIQPPPGTPVEIWAHQPNSAYATSFYIKNTANELWAVGGNNDGTLGNGTTVATQSWTRVLVDDVKDMATGAQHLVVLDNSGDVWFAGTNFENAWGMGSGGPTKVTTPVKITTLPPNAKAIASTWMDATIVRY
ncbi:hypothetical protein KNO15_10665 [Leifsonia shinshuensis]|uniref:hypothetical protein n=1 Tax=Leifsonia shinshuensis TaxID=150026 RepID=UPI001F511C83|nr:hypothetical protein [Leifsonia shinshuensis]MCI0157156.1 hypothetical protein [Leifsonia shinshuensis]